MAIRPSFCIFILYAPAKCHTPLLLMYIFFRWLRGYYIYKDI